ELMPRPLKYRFVEGHPPSDYFKPRGVPLASLEVAVLTLDEFEALRLADYEGLYQEPAAEKMGVSRQTFGKIVESARKKVADALVNSKAIRIEGGVYRTSRWERLFCPACDHQWPAAPDSARPANCPRCGADVPPRGPAPRRPGRRRGQGRGPGAGRG
ncbi:MAG: DUF134 domain-containing protein, partial [Candidatus Erginobacter occultus]|nr:DUF134 domain-containing protein [Candidatus Erginobacter occultus]